MFPVKGVYNLPIVKRTQRNDELEKLKEIMADKSKENFGLLKIPDSALLKDAITEIGKLKAYINELEDKLDNPEAFMKPCSLSHLLQANERLRNKNNELREKLYKKKKRIKDNLNIYHGL